MASTSGMYNAVQRRLVVHNFTRPRVVRVSTGSGSVFQPAREDKIFVFLIPLVNRRSHVYTRIACRHDCITRMSR